MAATRFASTKPAPTEVSSILEERIRGVSDEANLNETGRVLSVGYVLIGPITARESDVKKCAHLRVIPILTEQ